MNSVFVHFYVCVLCVCVCVCVCVCRQTGRVRQRDVITTLDLFTLPNPSLLPLLPPACPQAELAPFSIFSSMLSCFSCVLCFVTLWIIPCQAPLSIGFSRQEYWSRLHSLLKGNSQPRVWTHVSCIAGRLFTIWPIREARFSRLCASWSQVKYCFYSHNSSPNCK